MRISDWSSDVCSSDLQGEAAEADPAGGALDLGSGHQRQHEQHDGGDEPETGKASNPARRRQRDGNQQRGGEGQQRNLAAGRSEEHTSELQSLMRISYAVFCLKKKTRMK